MLSLNCTFNLNDVYNLIIAKIKERIQKTFLLFQNELSSIQRSRITPYTIENIKVQYYGSNTPILNIASICLTNSRTITIVPFDKTSLKEIQKAILKANIGVNPSIDKDTIRLSLPLLSEEQLNKLSAHVSNLAEEAKIALRNIRRDVLKQVDIKYKNKELRTDSYNNIKKDIQNIISKLELDINELVKIKKKELS